jgi:Smg protein
MRYIGRMFEVLVFVYENYWQGDACPETPQLKRKLSAVGFEVDEVREALTWLAGLRAATQGYLPVANAEPDALPRSLRVYSVAERDHLGVECLGFIAFMETAGYLPAMLREVVVDRAMAAGGDPMLDLDDLKIIILMVYWSLGTEPDTLLLDELCDDCHTRIAH